MNTTLHIIGVGGAGMNIIEPLEERDGVSLLAVNSNKERLAMYAPHPTFAVADTAKFNDALLVHLSNEEEAAMVKKLAGATAVALILGSGGATGAGVAPEIARIAADHGAAVYAYITTPFSFEEPIRHERSAHAEKELTSLCNSVETISLDRTVEATPGLPIQDSYLALDNKIRAHIKDLIESLGL